MRGGDAIVVSAVQVCCVIGMVGLRGDNKVIGHEHTHVESGGRRCACWGGKWGQLAAFRAVVATSSGAVEANPRFLGTNKNWDRVRSRRWPRGRLTLLETPGFISQGIKSCIYI